MEGRENSQHTPHVIPRKPDFQDKVCMSVVVVYNSRRRIVMIVIVEIIVVVKILTRVITVTIGAGAPWFHCLLPRSPMSTTPVMAY